MRVRLLLVISTVAIALSAGCSSSATGSNGANASNGVQSRTGKQIVAAAVAANKRQSSFHFVETAGAGSSTVRLVADVGSSSGEQHITVRDGTHDGKVTVLLAKGTAYFTGDVTGLEAFAGMSDKLAVALAGRWVSVPGTSASFSELASSLAVKTAAAQLVELTGTITRGATSSQLGHPAVAVEAAQSTTAGSLALTMYVATTGAALPILVTGTTRATGEAARRISASFSDWGEAVDLAAPKSSVPIADVQSLAG
ncbi:MAG: hypothetical protein ACLP36_06795 [Acidimicrobiales bacterium]